jgi:hypothetical protein
MTPILIIATSHLRRRNIRVENAKIRPMTLTLITATHRLDDSRLKVRKGRDRLVRQMVIIAANRHHDRQPELRRNRGGTEESIAVIRRIIAGSPLVVLGGLRASTLHMMRPQRGGKTAGQTPALARRV